MKKEVTQTKVKTNNKPKEVVKMRKTIMTVLLALLSVALVTVSANAAITGHCSDCHTMHNSQDGAAVNAGGTNDNLTKFSCIGCHSGSVAAAPNVFGQMAAERTAGGTFNSNIVDADANSHKKVHNVRDITWTNDETSLLNTIPGAEVGGFTEPTGAAELTCAGTKGCHGQASGGFKGFHHNGYPAAYRFLRFNDGAGNYTDIQGKGSSDREYGGATATNHNVYYALSADNVATRDSISSLCSMCHGDFHGSDDTSTTNPGTSPWRRHPTEMLIPSSWDSIGTGVAVDYDKTPFAFNGADYTGVLPTAAYSMSDNPRVACVSCHRAHGSDYDDLLRFNYADMNAGNSTNNGGCENCHTAQR
jgi:hypothetical protein